MRKFKSSFFLIGLLWFAAATWAQEESPDPASQTQGAPVAAEVLALQPSVPEAIDTDLLPHNLTPWGMFIAADWVVKAVMIGLALASVITWTVWLAKTLELTAAVRKIRLRLIEMGESKTLADAAKRLGASDEPAAELVRAAMAEANLSSDGTSEGLKERVGSRIERIEAAAGRRMMIGTGILATIGSTAPFVGLFGTVWGIMNAFIGISKSQTTNLAVVAPGIAEALLATALGLLAAIPAVIIYNFFARSISAYRALLADAGAEVLRLISRDLDRHAMHSPRTGG